MDGLSLAPEVPGSATDEHLPPPRKQRRPALSCVQCRRRKVKCDRNEPCNRCVQSKNTVCVYEPDQGIIRPKATKPLAKTSSTSLHNQNGVFNMTRDPIVLKSLQTPAPSIPDDLSSIASLGRGSIANHALSGQQTPESSTSLRAFQPEPSIDELKDRVRQLETMVSSLIHSDQSTTGSASPKSVARPPTLRGRHDKTRFFGMGHWLNIKKEFDQIHSMKSGTRSDKTCDIPKMLKSCKDMARSAKAQRPSTSYVAPDFRSQVPPREYSDLLVQNYFKSYESTYRILHRPLFYKEYERYWEDPPSAETSFVVKLLLVIIVGALFGPDSANGNSMRDLVPEIIYLVQNWLESAFSKSRINLAGVEIRCLLLLARQAYSLDEELFWITAGSLIRIAMSVGLHRDPSHFPKMTVLYAELRRRLWTTVLELAIQLSLDCGMPPLLSLDDSDCEPPSNYNDADFDEQTKEYPPRKVDTIFTESSIQISLHCSLRTRLEICTLINNFRSNPSHERVLALGTELTTYLRSYSQLYRISQMSNVPFTVSNMNLLDILSRRFLLALHLPYAIQARTNPRFYFSRKVALETAMVILAYPETGDSAEAFKRMKLTSGGCFRETISRASTAVGLELINQINEDSSAAFMLAPSPSSISRKPLHEAVNNAVIWSKLRLESADSNVKCYMFLSMVQAQTLAMEKGEDVKKAITDAATRACEDAYDILRKQVTHTPVDGLTPASSDGMSSGLPGIDNFDWDVLMQDTNLDFDITNSWLFDGWEDGSHPRSNTT